MPTDKEIEAAAKMLCWMNGIPECLIPDRGMACTPETCPHGLRDFGEEAKAALTAAEKVRHPVMEQDLAHPFLAVDDQDWDYLLSRLGYGGRGRFWKAVFSELKMILRSAERLEKHLATTPPTGKEQG